MRKWHDKAPQSGKPDAEERFYEEMAREWSVANENELVLGLGDFNGHVGKCAEGFEGTSWRVWNRKKKR